MEGMPCAWSMPCPAHDAPISSMGSIDIRTCEIAGATSSNPRATRASQVINRCWKRLRCKAEFRYLANIGPGSRDHAISEATENAQETICH